jgi:hypothetical protein
MRGFLLTLLGRQVLWGKKETRAKMELKTKPENWRLLRDRFSQPLSVERADWPEEAVGFDETGNPLFMTVLPIQQHHASSTSGEDDAAYFHRKQIEYSRWRSTGAKKRRTRSESSTAYWENERRKLASR